MVSKKSSDEELFIACLLGKEETVRGLIASGSVDLNFRDVHGWSALHMVVYDGFGQIAQILLDNGADIDIQDKLGRSPLLLSFQHEKIQMAKWLIERGANVHLLKDNDETVLFDACRIGHMDIVQMLIQRGLEVNVQNKYGKTCLFYTNKIEIADFLLKQGNDINLKNKDGETCLFGLCAYGKLELAKFFIEHGADVNIRNNRGQTALFGACFNGHTQLVRLLIDNGIDILVEDKYDKSAFSFAFDRKHQEILKLIGKRIIKSLYESFQYSDYDAFRSQVFDSIDDPTRFPIKSDHLKALRALSSIDFNDSTGEIKYFNFFRSFDFQEKLLEDVRNNLQDQFDILELGKLKIEDSFSNLFTKNEIDCSLISKLKCSHISSLIIEHALLDTIQQENNEIEQKVKAISLMSQIKSLKKSINKYLNLVDSLFEILSSQ